MLKSNVEVIHMYPDQRYCFLSQF